MTKARTLADNFAADINGITAGTGITGGGTSGTVTITNDMATTINAKGDLVVGTANDTYSRLAVASTAGYLLSVDSAEATGLKWIAPAAAGFVGCSLDTTSSSFNVNNNTWTAVSWDSELFDTDGFHSNTTNNSRITIPSGKAGKYLVTAKTGWDNVTSGEMNISIYKNGTSFENINGICQPYISMHITIIMDLAVNDYIQVYVRQASGSAQTAYNNGVNGAFSVSYLGA